MEVKAGYKQTDVGVIPEDWDVQYLHNIVDYMNGKAHERNISHIGQYIVVNSRFISTDGTVRKYSNHSLCPTITGDVLMVMSDIPNGKAIAKCYWIDADDIYTVNQRICRLRPRNVNGKLLFYKLNRNPQYLAFDDGVKQTNLRKADVLGCTLALPKLHEEQKAIANALSDVDQLIASLDQLIAKKRDLKQAAMQQLLTGKTRLAGFSGEWETKRLGEVVAIVKGQLITQDTVVDGTIPVIAGGKKPAYFHNIANRFGKTITVSGSGASAGYVAKYDEPIFASDCCTISEGSTYDLDYIYYYLLSRQSHIYRSQTGGAQPHIHPKDLQPMIVGIPSHGEQVAIAATLSDMDAELTELAHRRDKTIALKQGMMQELLTGRTRLV